MNVEYVRLNEDVCQTLNDRARDRRMTVSDLVNEILREYLRSASNDLPAHGEK